MIPDSEVLATLDGDIDAEATNFDMDQESLAHLMGLFSDLYSKRALAVLREYATNALDATLAAGKTTPVEVTLPSSMDPTLIVQDFGTGLSADEIRMFYGRYGYSTKRGTNAQTGMLGIGCKVGIAFADQMTLEAVKDGVLATVLITKNERGVGQLQVVGEFQTDRPNGVKVSVPVSNIREMRDASEELFRYWQPGTVLVDGEAPENVWETPNLVAIDDDIILVPGSYNGKVVMGNVPYPTDRANIGNFSVVARIPVGSVAFTPSREALQDSDLTTDTLTELKNFVQATYVRKIQERLDSFEDPADAVKLATSMSGIRPYNGRYPKPFTYRGTPIPNQVPAQGYVWNSYYDSRAEKLHGTTSLFSLAEARLVVVGSSRIGSNMKRKVQKYLDDRGESSGKVYFIEKNPAPAWIVENVVSHDLIRDVKVPSLGRTSTRKSGIRVINYEGDLDYVAELSEDDRLVFTTSELPTWDRPALGRLAAYMKGVSVVSVRKGGEAKFQRDYPDALTIDEFLELAAKEVMASINLAAHYVSVSGYSARPNLQPDITRLDDPDLVKYLELFRSSSNDRTGEAYRLLQQAWANFGKQGLPPIDISEYTALGNRVRQQYPFLTSYRDNGVDPTWLCNAWKRDHDLNPTTGDTK